MKRRILIIVTVLVIIGTGGIIMITNTIPLKLDSEKISYMVVRNGTTGKGIKLDSNDEVTEIVALFNELRLEKGKRLEPFSGFTIALSVYSKSNTEKPDGYIVLSYGVIHKNHMYNISNIDTEANLYEHLLNMFD